MPQVHEPGIEAEVDWGEAVVEIAGQRRTVYLFLMRACYSGAAFVIAFERQTQQAFLEAHVEAFGFFGGAFALIRYDNLRAAVKQVLRGRRRVEQDRFVALRSHYLFESAFTRPGREGAHEKGGVEGEVGRYRRRHLVPVPKVASLKELNELLEDGCFAELERRIAGRAETVGEALRVETRALRPLPIEEFDASEQAIAARRREGAGDDPAKPLLGAGRAGRCCASRRRIGAREIVISHDRPRGRPPPAPARPLPDRRPARPLPRAAAAQAGRAQGLAAAPPGARAWRLAGLLRRALAGSSRSATAPPRRPGRWSTCCLLCRELGADRVELAVSGALAAGAHDGRAVALLARRSERPAQLPLFELPERLRASGRPQPTLGDYDQLLSRGGAR